MVYLGKATSSCADCGSDEHAGACWPPEFRRHYRALLADLDRIERRAMLQERLFGLGGFLLGAVAMLLLVQWLSL